MTLICPLCQTTMISTTSGVVCLNNHNFDRAKQGYLNLLPVQHKNSRSPGDNKTMVTARKNFLSSNLYQPIAQKLAEKVTSNQPIKWLDIGCGEGYYTDFIAHKLALTECWALDISKEAIKSACKRSTRIKWLVASMTRIPLTDQSCDLITNIFSPIDWNEIQRILQAKGKLLRVTPTQNHLIELRQKIYTEVNDYNEQKHLDQIPDTMHLVHSEVLTISLNLTNQIDRANLLLMTPHGWKTSEKQQQIIINEPLSVTLSVRYDTIQYR